MAQLNINISGTFYYLCSILDGCSRYIVNWDLRESGEHSIPGGQPTNGVQNQRRLNLIAGGSSANMRKCQCFSPPTWANPLLFHEINELQSDPLESNALLLGPDGPSGTFTRWENETIPW